jgi:hypothetical protein
MWNPFKTKLQRAYYAGIKRGHEDFNSEKINRVEVIDDENGRAYVNYDAHNVVISIQDNGCTIKIFIGT